MFENLADKMNLNVQMIESSANDLNKAFDPKFFQRDRIIGSVFG